MMRLFRRTVVSIVVLLAFNGLTMAASEPIELRIYSWWGSVQHAVIKKAADIWAADHPGVTVVVLRTPGSSDSMEGLIANTVSGVPMDLMILQTPFIQYASQGLLLPLDELAKSGEWATEANYPPQLLDSFRSGDKIYGFPGIEAGVGMLLFYNKGLFAEAGWPDNQPPATLEELALAHRKLSRKDPNTGQFAQIGWNPFDAMPGSYFETIYSTMFNLDWYDVAQQSVSTMAFEPLIDWGQQTYEVTTYAEIAAAGIPRWTPGLLTGKLAMQINGSWVPSEARNQYKDSGNLLEIGYSWVPNSVGDRATAVLPWGVGIPSTSRYPELAYSLMDFLVSPEGMQILFDELGWLTTNMASLPKVNVDAVPEVKQAISMFMEADRVAATPSLINLIPVRNAIRDAAYYAWRGDTPPREALENASRQLR